MTDVSAGRYEAAGAVTVEDVREHHAGGMRYRTGSVRLPGHPVPLEVMIFARAGCLRAVPAHCSHEGRRLPGVLHGDVLRCPAHGLEIAVFGEAARSYVVREVDGVLMLAVEGAASAAVGQPADRAAPPQADVARPADEALQQLERELGALREANAVQEAEISASAAIVDSMLGELEAQRNALRQAHLQQVATHAFIARVMDSMDGLLLVIDVEGRISRANREFLRLAGLTSEQAQGRAVDSLLPAHERDALAAGLPPLPWGVKSVVFETMRRHHRYRAEHRLRLHGMVEDGDVYLVQGTLLHDPQGKLEGAVITATNIAAMKAQEAALRESEARFRLTTQFAKDAIVLIDEHDRIYSWNLAAEAMFGYREAETIGREFHPLIVPERYHARFRVGFEHFRATGEGSGAVGRTRELTAFRRDGSEFPVEVSVSAVKIGDSYHSVGLMRDITERKRAEVELARYRAGLEELVESRTRELVAARDAAEAANHAKSAFLANMSHELRTPLHAVLSFSALGVDRLASARPEQLLRYFTAIHDSGKRLQGLLNDLLDLSRMEAGEMHLERRPVNPAELARDVMAEFADGAASRGIRLELHAPVHALSASLDRVRMGQVLRHLLSNAVRYSAAGGRVAVVVDVAAGPGGEAGWLRLAVEDEGVGIPPDELAAVFRKFVQSSRTRTKAGGTGLGLAICREIVEAHGGRITAANRVEGGARFEVVMPLQQAADPPSPAAADGADGAARNAPA